MGVYYRGLLRRAATAPGPDDAVEECAEGAEGAGEPALAAEGGTLANEGLGFRGYSGIMEKKLETTIVFRV